LQRRSSKLLHAVPLCEISKLKKGLVMLHRRSDIFPKEPGNLIKFALCIKIMNFSCQIICRNYCHMEHTALWISYRHFPKMNIENICTHSYLIVLKSYCTNESIINIREFPHPKGKEKTGKIILKRP
jgi:hypothetical protein